MHRHQDVVVPLLFVPQERRLAPQVHLFSSVSLREHRMYLTFLLALINQRLLSISNTAEETPPTLSLFPLPKAFRHTLSNANTTHLNCNLLRLGLRFPGDALE